LDCANGVGALQFAKFTEKIKANLKFELINTKVDQYKLINEACGAEYVQKEISYPASFNVERHGVKACSFDGDADRLIYFTHGVKNSGKPIVIDGDK
jgi:phosphoacetylglucosamine mutase